jgi:hypothetical protein
MIPGHERFLQAIQDLRKVSIRFYSTPDNGVLDRVVAPLDYGPGTGEAVPLNRYWVWDYAGEPGARTLGLVPQQVVSFQVLGEPFSPADTAGWQASVAGSPGPILPPEPSGVPAAAGP